MADLSLSPIDEGYLKVLAEIHAASFPQSWSREDLGNLVCGGASGLVLNALEEVAGFLLWRIAAGEAEILTIAVAPRHRRQGAGGRLLRAALDALSIAGAREVYLEVAEDNPAALKLYRAAGFATVGRRRGYYQREGKAIDAQVLQLKLNTEGH
jgi:ribosomal-protein-alanine N-acetyltransferase